MRIQALIGSVLVVGLLGIGILLGSVLGTVRAGAQTASQTPAQAATTTPAPSTTNPAPPLGPKVGGMGGKRGHGPGGLEGFGGFGGFGARGGFDRGFPGRAVTAEGAAGHITATTNLIALVRGDLTYATGKMDTADVQRWLNEADGLLKNAQSAVSGSKFEQASAYAQAASELAMTAEAQMAQKLGANTLPSYSQRPQHPGKGAIQGQPANTTLNQAQASRLLAATYNRLTMLGAVVGNASNAGNAPAYLTEAQNAYKSAYTAYQAGNYAEAATFAQLARRLAGVAGSVLRATTSPGNSDAPVTVPAPNF